MCDLADEIFVPHAFLNVKLFPFIKTCLAKGKSMLSM